MASAWLNRKGKCKPLQFSLMMIFIWDRKFKLLKFKLHLNLFITWFIITWFGYNRGNGHYRMILLYDYIFYSRYNTDWIANTEVGLDLNNSVIKRLWCISDFN